MCNSKILLLFIATLFAAANGLQCYNCIGHAGSDLPDRYKSCQNGNTPDSSLSQVCPPNTFPNGTATPLLCAQTVADIEYDSGPLEETIRGCIYPKVQIPSGKHCSKMTMGELSEILHKAPNTGKITAQDQDKSVTFCHCDTDDCNDSNECIGDRCGHDSGEMRGAFQLSVLGTIAITLCVLY